MSVRFLSSSGTLFHALDAKYQKEFKPTCLVLAELTKNQFETLSYRLVILVEIGHIKLG